MESPTPHRHPPPSLIGPAFLIGLGTILLLNVTGYLTWSIWEIVQLWPLLPIAAGLQILIGKRSSVGAFASAIIMLGLFVGSVWVIGANPGITGGEVLEISEPKGDIRSARVILSPAVAQVEVNALDDSENFVEGLVQLARNEKLHRSFSGGSAARFSLETRSRSRVRAANPDAGRRWRFNFNPDVSLDLEVNLGIGNVNLDFARLNLSDCEISFGVGELGLTLPQTSSSDMKISGGVGTITIMVPPNVGVRLRADTAIAGRSLPASYTQNGDVYESPNYDESDYRIDIDVDLGIGSLTVNENRRN